MKVFAIELDDRSLSLAREGRVLSSAPSVVFDGTVEPAGAPAWHALRVNPTAISSRHLGAVVAGRVPPAEAVSLVAAELGRRLAEHPREDGERVWITAPVRVEAQGLGTMLSVTRSLGLPVDGFVDAAALSVAALGLDRMALVLELGLHHVAITAVDSDSQARRRHGVISERGGLLELYEAWLDLVSTAMVRRTRFDPLHEAATEQQLFDSLPEVAREAGATGAATAAVTVGGNRIETPLTRDQFVQAGQFIYDDILRLMHELRPAGAPVALVMPQKVAALPGLRDALEQFSGCELVTLPEGFAAAALSLLDPPRPESEDHISLLRRLPVRRQPRIADEAGHERLGERRAGTLAPSHVLFNGHAYSLAVDALVVGRAPGGAHRIELPEGMAGVSRRHCTFLRHGGELVLVDHSSFGTFVNGERVAERVRVRAGDRVRIGEPGVELALIAVAGTAVSESHGTATS